MNPLSEWLETDGLGGFASGTVSGLRTRRYHAVLLVATTPPTGRMALVNGLEAWVETPQGRFALTSHRYAPDVVHPDGAKRIEAFDLDPWPRWTYRLEDGTRLCQELFSRHGSPIVVVSWRLLARRPGIRLEVRPLLSGRDTHSLHHENGGFRFDAETTGGILAWRPYPGVPGILARANAEYRHAPEWYRNFLSSEERNRGLDFIEDLASPGSLAWDLSEGEAACVLAADSDETRELLAADPRELLTRMRAAEKRRRKFPTGLHRAADAYIVQRGSGLTIVAGYPWFTDWGRDTFIALRGLCLATGSLDVARRILVGWSDQVSEGMLPNVFDERGDAPQYNSVDASLWYVIAVYEYLRAAQAAGREPSARDRARLVAAVDAILDGYSRGTRYQIHADEDGLLACGEPGVALTWMDAKVGDWVVTPRIGKPVEVQALWLNALGIGGILGRSRGETLERGLASFRERFWNEAAGCLYDVVDDDHVPGAVDARVRPNQLFAVGGLPFTLIDGTRGRRVVDTVEKLLWTPLGPRSLAPGEPGYTPRYRGGVAERDGAYHQGTVWPWLAGAFVEAWVRVHGDDGAARQAARERFLTPLLGHLDTAGLGHISEIADAEPPFTPRGCPFQAWSVGEALRLDRVVLVDSVTTGPASDENPRPLGVAGEESVPEVTLGGTHEETVV
jgi:predicted glycogen debranching enzyme